MKDTKFLIFSTLIAIGLFYYFNNSSRVSRSSSHSRSSSSTHSPSKLSQKEEPSKSSSTSSTSPNLSNRPPPRLPAEAPRTGPPTPPFSRLEEAKAALRKTLSHPDSKILKNPRGEITTLAGKIIFSIRTDKDAEALAQAIYEIFTEKYPQQEKGSIQLEDHSGSTSSLQKIYRYQQTQEGWGVLDSYLDIFVPQNSPQEGTESSDSEEKQSPQAFLINNRFFEIRSTHPPSPQTPWTLGLCQAMEEIQKAGYAPSGTCEKPLPSQGKEPLYWVNETTHVAERAWLIATHTSTPSSQNQNTQSALDSTSASSHFVLVVSAVDGRVLSRRSSLIR